MNDSDKTIRIMPPRHIEWAAVAALALLALFLLAEAIGAFQNLDRAGVPATDTITVSGTGQATAAPDIATIDFTVEHSATAVADAQAATTAQANAALGYLKGQGIADKDIRTLSYNVTPQYAYQNQCPPGALCPTYVGTPKVTGYQVSETVEVKVHGLTKVGALLGGLGQQNVQNISGPNFTLEDPTAPQNEARAEAITKAKAQAEELAKELGVHLVRIVNFSEGGNYPIYAMALGKGATDSASVPQVPTGENAYTSNVTITYEIR